jgi:hypothetical protein
VPAVPAIIQGGLAVGGALASGAAGRAASRAAMARSPEELRAIQRVEESAGQAGRLSQQYGGLATPMLGQAFNYYGTLLGGNRAAIRQAVSPELQDISEAYKGADTAIGKGYLAGGERNQALAENARARAGQISRLIGSVRPMAAQAGGQLAGQVAGIGQQAQYLSTLANQGLLQQGFSNRLLGQQAGMGAASQWGSLFARLSSVLGPSIGKLGTKTKPPIDTRAYSRTLPPLGGDFGTEDWYHG